MPNILRDATNSVPLDNSIRLQLIGTLVSAIAYGYVVSLFFHCLALLIPNTRHSYTRRTRSVLIVYVVVMFLLSTGSIIQSFVYIIRAIFIGVDPTSYNIIKMNEPIFLPLVILGTDGLLLWRCIILYRDALWRTLIYCVLFSTSMGSFGFAIVYYLSPQVSLFSFHSPLTPSVVMVSITASMNLIRATVITGRLLYHQETMKKIIGKQYGSPYFRVMVMIVESCCPIIVTGTVYLILVKGASTNTFNGGIIPLLLLPHVCVASPLLIVYQVGRRRTFTSLRPSDIRASGIITPNIAGIEDCMSPIRFQRPITTVLNSENTSTTSQDSESGVDVIQHIKSENLLDRSHS